MGRTLLHLGCNPIGLSSFVTIFSSIPDTQVFLLNNDSKFDNQDIVDYWSNLQLKKVFTISPELAFASTEVKITGVVDTFNAERIKKILETSNNIYFSISLNFLKLRQEIEFLLDIIILRQKLNCSASLTFLIIDGDYTINTFIHQLETLNKIRSSSLKIDYSKLSFVECITDILCSIPIYKKDKCVVFSEIIQGPKRIYFRDIDFDKVNGIGQQASQKRILDEKNVVFLESARNDKATFPGFEAMKKIKLVYAIYKYLLAILTIDSDNLYIFGYLKFGRHSNLIAEGMIDELLKICAVKKVPIESWMLPQYLERLKNFGTNVTQVLPITDTEKLRGLYNYLYGQLFLPIQQHNHFNQDRITIIPYTLDLLYKQL